jgi:hypothetical protein
MPHIHPCLPAFAVYANVIADATAMASDDMFDKL